MTRPETCKEIHRCSSILEVLSDSFQAGHYGDAAESAEALMLVLQNVLEECALQEATTVGNMVVQALNSNLLDEDDPLPLQTIKG